AEGQGHPAAQARGRAAPDQRAAHHRAVLQVTEPPLTPPTFEVSRMRIRWRNFELPSQVRLDRETATSQYGKFVVEPFEKGFGATIGNGLRRVLLSSIEGTAVTWVKIDGVVHEFSTIAGVLEDVTQIILNIKKLRVKMHTDAPTTLRIDVNKRGEVR